MKDLFRMDKSEHGFMQTGLNQTEICQDPETAKFILEVLNTSNFPGYPGFERQSKVCDIL